mmetsp:Transcript_16958/g.40457  ORF Transcript_16958/g.40457 Transcript_16958/m.40457 type:complete len:273 (-) Transcript_16958:548-1366(-)
MASVNPLKVPDCEALILWAFAQSFTSVINCKKRPSISPSHCKTSDFSIAAVLDKQRLQEIPEHLSTNFNTGTLERRTTLTRPLEILDPLRASTISLKISLCVFCCTALSCFGGLPTPSSQVPSSDRSRLLKWLQIPETNDPYGTIRRPFCIGKLFEIKSATRLITSTRRVRSSSVSIWVFARACMAMLSWPAAPTSQSLALCHLVAKAAHASSIFEVSSLGASFSSSIAALSMAKQAALLDSLFCCLIAFFLAFIASFADLLAAICPFSKVT